MSNIKIPRQNGKPKLTAIKLEMINRVKDRDVKVSSAGFTMTGEAVGADIVLNEEFLNHSLCGPRELPFMLKGADPTDIYQTFFLKITEYNIEESADA